MSVSARRLPEFTREGVRRAERVLGMALGMAVAVWLGLGVGCRTAEPEINAVEHQPPLLTERTAVDTWTHPDHVPAKKPVVVGVRAVNNARWQQTQADLRWAGADLLAMFHAEARHADFPDMLLAPLTATTRGELTVQGSNREIVETLCVEMQALGLDAIFLIRLDRYDPGTGRSRYGTAFLPEVAFLVWLVSASGDTIWVASAGSRADDLPPERALVVGEVNAFASESRRAFRAMIGAYGEFWNSEPMQRKRTQAVPVPPATHLWPDLERLPTNPDSTPPNGTNGTNDRGDTDTDDAGSPTNGADGTDRGDGPNGDDASDESSPSASETFAPDEPAQPRQ